MGIAAAPATPPVISQRDIHSHTLLALVTLCREELHPLPIQWDGVGAGDAAVRRGLRVQGTSINFYCCGRDSVKRINELNKYIGVVDFSRVRVFLR